MNFINLHYMGGPIFMVPLSIIALIILTLSIRKAYDLYQSQGSDLISAKVGLDSILYLGSFAFFWGILGNAIALYSALQAIEQIGNVSPAMLAGGLKISLIVPLYGLIIFMASSILWFVLRTRYLSLSQNIG